MVSGLAYGWTGHGFRRWYAFLQDVRVYILQWVWAGPKEDGTKWRCGQWQQRSDEGSI